MNTSILKRIMFTVFVILFMTFLFNLQANAAVENFTIDDENIELQLNATKLLTYQGGSGDVTWESNNQGVATVENGRIQAKGVGTAIITGRRGAESDTCTVNVVYAGIRIGANEGSNVSSVNLLLGEHPTEKLTASVKDYMYSDVPGASVTWTSSAPGVVNVDSSTGLLTAVAKGTATITAKATGVEDTCEVEVSDAPVFTDFSNAVFDTELNWTTDSLKISGIVPIEDTRIDYRFFVTPTNERPELLVTKYGYLDTDNMSTTLLSKNTEENYIYSNHFAKYSELNQDLYLWVIQQNDLEKNYYNDEGTRISCVCKYVVEGKKIERDDLPPLNIVLQSFDIGKWGSNLETPVDGKFTYVRLNFPTETDHRNFRLKIGKVTDYSILTKIQNNDYNGIVELLNYAKNNNAIYDGNLTTVYPGYYSGDDMLFDGRQLLEDDAYYYIYAELDDENGKYYPIEGVTLGQAWFSVYSDDWNLNAYTSSDFEWNNLHSTYNGDTSGTPGTDNTTAPGTIPQTGSTCIAIVSLVIFTAFGIVSYIKYKKLNDIK